MRSVLVRFGLSLIVLGPLWLLASRQAVLLIDRIHTVPVAALPSNPVGWNGTFLQFDTAQGGHILGLDGPGPDYRQPASLTVDDQERLVISVDGRSVVLGPRAGTLPGADGPIPAYAAEPGNQTALTIARSWLSWPSFLDFHFGLLDGPSTSWRRNTYYRLSWKKKSGAQLDLLWRFEQGYDSVNGWSEADGTRDGATGMISAQLRSAPDTD